MDEKIRTFVQIFSSYHEERGRGRREKADAWIWTASAFSYPAILSNRANLQEYASSMHRLNVLISSPEAAVIYFSPQAEVPFFYPYGISPLVQHGAFIL